MAKQEHEEEKEEEQNSLPQRVEWCLGNEKLIVPSHAWQNDVKVSVNNTWQISPCRHMLLVGAFVLDGTKRFYNKSQGRIVPKDAKGISPPELCRKNGKCEHSEYSAVRQFLFAKDFARRSWRHGRTNLEANWHPRETKYLVDQ